MTRPKSSWLPWAAVWAVGGASLLGPWLQVKPNRIVEGTVRTLAGDDTGWGLLLLALGAIPLVAALVRPGSRWAVRAGWVLCIVVPALLAFAAGAAAVPLVPDGSFARVSPSWVFWCLVLGCYGGGLVLGPRTGWPTPWQALGKAVFPLGLLVGLALGSFDHLSLLREYAAQPDVFWNEFRTHLVLAGTAVALGVLVGAAVGWAAHRLDRFRQAAFFVLNVVQTLPSLALFGLLIVPLAALGWGGIGPVPALIALGLYAAFPIARSTLTAFDNLDPSILDAGRGQGMGRWQLFSRVQLPLALPVVLEGVRTSSVQAVGNTVVAALIGAGGLGSLIFFGLGQFAPDLILLGTIPVVVLALVLDLFWAVILGLLARRVRT